MPAPGLLRWAEWEDQYIVYHQDSGDTHQLNGLAAHALMNLPERGLPSSDLTTMVAGSLGLEADDVLHSALDRALADLRRIGLVVSTSIPSNQ